MRNSKEPGASRRAARLQPQRGASLIEIMVVLLVLLIGISLAIRVFPVGFSSIRATGNQGIAQRLAEGKLEELRTEAVSLPQGVQLAFDGNGDGALDVVTNVDPDDMGQYNPDPNTTPAANPFFSDVNKFRYIQGEVVRIPLAASGEGGASHALKFSPIYMDPVVGTRDNAPDPTNATQMKQYNSYLQVRGAPLTRLVREAGAVGSTEDASGRNVSGVLRNQQTYLIDYGDDQSDALIMFAPRNAAGTARTFVISYSYDLESSDGVGTFTASIPVTDANSGRWLPIPGPAANGGVKDILPGSETVSRAFDRIPFTQLFNTTDPYQYKLASSNVGVNSVANYGVLVFNPTGASYVERTPYGERAFTAYVDYSVLDWHILTETKEIPVAISDANGLLPVRLSLRDIKRIGDPQQDNTFYQGLYPGSSLTAAQGRDIQVFKIGRLNNGQPARQGRIIKGTPVPDPNSNDPNVAVSYYVDEDPRNGSYRTGTIYINPNGPDQTKITAGSQVRILYKARGDWAVSLQKAYSEYELARDNNGNIAPYPIPGAYNKVGKDGFGATAQLRFPLADLNKSFVVTLQYLDQSRRNAAEWVRMPPIQVTANRRGSANVDPTTYDPDYAIVQLSEFLSPSDRARFASVTDAQNWQVIGAIQGVSVKTRVIWKDDEDTNKRWRIRDMNSIVPPLPQ